MKSPVSAEDLLGMDVVPCTVIVAPDATAEDAGADDVNAKAQQQLQTSRSVQFDNANTEYAVQTDHCRS
jgi:hypothetical protein